jgi:hypothetical protein
MFKKWLQNVFETISRELIGGVRCLIARPSAIAFCHGQLQFSGALHDSCGARDNHKRDQLLCNSLRKYGFVVM